MRHAQTINRRYGWSDHLWQGRFFSSRLDDAHLWAAVRYVERNPGRAGIVSRAEDYPWSSAAAHCGFAGGPVTLGSTAWDAAFAGLCDWSAWLQATDEADTMQRLRSHVACVPWRGVAVGNRLAVATAASQA